MSPKVPHFTGAIRQCGDSFMDGLGIIRRVGHSAIIVYFHLSSNR